MLLRVLCLLVALAVSACATASSPYFGTRGATDIPPGIQSIKVTKLIPMDPSVTFTDNVGTPDSRVDPSPTPEILAAGERVNNRLGELFNKSGIVLVNGGDSRQPLSMRIYYHFTDYGVTRGLGVHLVFDDAEGRPLFHHSAFRAPAGILSMIALSHEMILDDVTERISALALAELRKPNLATAPAR